MIWMPHSYLSKRIFFLSDTHLRHRFLDPLVSHPHLTFARHCVNSVLVKSRICACRTHKKKKKENLVFTLRGNLCKSGDYSLSKEKHPLPPQQQLMVQCRILDLISSLFPPGFAHCLGVETTASVVHNEHCALNPHEHLPA